MRRELPSGRNVPDNPLPGVCDVSVTKVPKAVRDFLGVSRGKQMIGTQRYLGAAASARILRIVYRRRARYLAFRGVKPLVPPGTPTLVESSGRSGVRCSLITNGWLPPRCIDDPAPAELKRPLILIDTADMAAHGLDRGCRRRKSASGKVSLGLMPWGSGLRLRHCQSLDATRIAPRTTCRTRVYFVGLLLSPAQVAQVHIARV